MRSSLIFRILICVSAKTLNKIGVQVLYFVAPQAWAWRPNRAQIIAQISPYTFSILPFEAEWFRQRGVKISLVCLILLSAGIGRFKQYSEQFAQSEVKTRSLHQYTILPGSRASEIRYHFRFIWNVLKP